MHRLSTLSREDLLELAIGGCVRNADMRRRAEEMLAQQTPLPSWCVDVLLSPDVLPQVFDQLAISDKAAAAACRTWAAGWDALLRRRQYVRPQLLETISLSKVAMFPVCGVVLPSGQLVIHDNKDLWLVSETGQIKKQIKKLRQMYCTDYLPCAMNFYAGHLYTADMSNGVTVIKLRDDGTTKVVAGSDREDLDGVWESGELCIAGDEIFVPCMDEVNVLDAKNLELKRTICEDDFDYEGINTCAVHDDQLYVSGLRNGEVTLGVFSLDGELLRTIRGDFGNPRSIAFYYGYLWMIEKDEEEDGVKGRLLVLDPKEGVVRQAIWLPPLDDGTNGCRAYSMSFHDNVVYVYGGPDHAAIYVIKLTQLGGGSSCSASASNDALEDAAR